MIRALCVLNGDLLYRALPLKVVVTLASADILILVLTNLIFPASYMVYAKLGFVLAFLASIAFLVRTFAPVDRCECKILDAVRPSFILYWYVFISLLVPLVHPFVADDMIDLENSIVAAPFIYLGYLVAFHTMGILSITDLMDARTKKRI